MSEDVCIPHTRILTVRTSLTAEPYVLDPIQHVLFGCSPSISRVVEGGENGQGSSKVEEVEDDDPESCVWKYFWFIRSDVDQTVTEVVAGGGNTSNSPHHLSHKHALENQECTKLKSAPSTPSGPTDQA